MALRLMACALSLFLAALVLASCEQGEGDVCQVSADCEPGLLCSASTGLCERPLVEVVDASPTVDGPPAVDAMPADAMPVDAMPADAGPDAL